MIYRKKSEMKLVPIEHCMGGEGTVMMEKLLNAPEEMLGKGRAYVRHTINGEIQHLEAGDIIGAMPGDTHGIACEGNEPLIIIAQVLYE